MIRTVFSLTALFIFWLHGSRMRHFYFVFEDQHGQGVPHLKDRLSDDPRREHQTDEAGKLPPLFRYSKRGYPPGIDSVTADGCFMESNANARTLRTLGFHHTEVRFSMWKSPESPRLLYISMGQKVSFDGGTYFVNVLREAVSRERPPVYDFEITMPLWDVPTSGDRETPVAPPSPQFGIRVQGGRLDCAARERSLSVSRARVRL